MLFEVRVIKENGVQVSYKHGLDVCWFLNSKRFAEFKQFQADVGVVHKGVVAANHKVDACLQHWMDVFQHLDQAALNRRHIACRAYFYWDSKLTNLLDLFGCQI